jgi:hypothetical protein
MAVLRAVILGALFVLLSESIIVSDDEISLSMRDTLPRGREVVRPALIFLLCMALIPIEQA